MADHNYMIPLSSFHFIFIKFVILRNMSHIKKVEKNYSLQRNCALLFIILKF